MDLELRVRVVENNIRTEKLEERIEEPEKATQQPVKDHQANQTPLAEQPAAEARVNIEKEERVDGKEAEEDPDDFPDPSPLRPRARVQRRSGNTVTSPSIKRRKRQILHFIRSTEKTREEKRQRCEAWDSNAQLAPLPTNRAGGPGAPRSFTPITRCAFAERTPAWTPLCTSGTSPGPPFPGDAAMAPGLGKR